jgi:hypothetical protein
LGVFGVGVLAGCIMGAQALLPTSNADPPAVPAPSSVDSAAAVAEAPSASTGSTPSAPASPSAAASHQVPGSGALHNAATSQCVDAERKEGTRARLSSCGDADSQRWRLQAAGNGVYLIANVASGQCLDVSKRSKDDGAAVQIWGCNQGPNQQWALRWGQAETFTLLSVNSGKCLDIDDGKLEQRACRNVDTQQWAF